MSAFTTVSLFKSIANGRRATLESARLKDQYGM